ncbi:hypothetical protein [Marivita geojedonensis]|uniref:hypothetical protein n=1 Tax=Marivita geojedonensis TaxID=1123756 RepID=UPI00117D2C6B|nr:hypothetical protein [Marivita geojedonensis]
MSESLQQILSDFSQAASRDMMDATVAPDFSDAITRLERSKSLRLASVETWPAPSRKALVALLKTLSDTIDRRCDNPFGQVSAQGSSPTMLSGRIIGGILLYSKMLEREYHHRRDSTRSNLL